MDRPIDPSAAQGFKDALAYEAHRPSYPPETVDKLTSLLPSAPGRAPRIIDLAAGTGKLTELIAERLREYEIKAVEPHRQMRDVLDRKSFARVDVVDGTAAEMGSIPGGWADGLTVAQAFHWFANADALREIHRVLAPRGVLLLLWNEEDYNSQTSHTPVTAWETSLRALAWSFDDAQRQFRNASWRDVFDEDHSACSDGNFDPWVLFALPLQTETLYWTVWLTRQALWDRFSTLSFIANLGEQEREDVRRRVFDILTKGDVEINNDEKIAVHGRTHMVWTFKKSAGL